MFLETASAFVNSISGPRQRAQERLHGLRPMALGGLQEAQALHGQDDAGLVADPPAQLQACCPVHQALSWSLQEETYPPFVVTLRELLLVASSRRIRGPPGRPSAPQHIRRGPSSSAREVCSRFGQALPVAIFA